MPFIRLHYAGIPVHVRRCYLNELHSERKYPCVKSEFKSLWSWSSWCGGPGPTTSSGGTWQETLPARWSIKYNTVPCVGYHSSCARSSGNTPFCECASPSPDSWVLSPDCIAKFRTERKGNKNFLGCSPSEVFLNYLVSSFCECREVLFWSFLKFFLNSRREASKLYVRSQITKEMLSRELKKYWLYTRWTQTAMPRALAPRRQHTRRGSRNSECVFLLIILPLSFFALVCLWRWMWTDRSMRKHNPWICVRV